MSIASTAALPAKPPRRGVRATPPVAEVDAVAAAAAAEAVKAIRGAVREHWQAALIAGRCASERHHIATQAGVNTGYWSWKEDHHAVVIGEEIRERLVEGGKGLEAYIAKFLRHELAHARNTERDLKKLDAAAKKEKVPFALLNLFEDAWIEAKEVAETGEPFGWLDHEPMPEATGASASIFCLIQAEGAQLAEWEGLPRTDFRCRAAHYYRKTVAAKDSWGVLKVAAEFVKEFPAERAVELNIPNFRADMLAALQAFLGLSPGKGLTVLVDGRLPPVTAPEDPDKRLPASRSHSYSSAQVLPPHKSRKMSPDQMAQAKQLADRLSKEFIARTGWTSTVSPTRRLNARRLALDTDAIYRSRTEFRVGRIKLRLVVDLSGSMSEEPSIMVRIVMTALAILAKRGHAEGTVTLSAQHGYETFDLAMSDEQISHLEGYSSAEGLARTFRELEALFADSDLVMCLTDGEITDGPVDVARLRRRGIRCLGLYLGSRQYAVSLAKWFASYLCCETMQEIIDEIGVRARPIIRGRAVRS